MSYYLVRVTRQGLREETAFPTRREALRAFIETTEASGYARVYVWHFWNGYEGPKETIVSKSFPRNK